tara:strand:+ start:1330 stop:1929 length:600 start_codon:yes stop_codon:yes gene_type:complete
MKKLIYLLENILKKVILRALIINIAFFSNCFANEKWVIDKNLSSINFEVPILFATNVLGKFKNIDGFVEIDLENKTNNKALLSVSIDSIETNYEKYRDLLLGPIFFDSLNYPIGLLDTKKFSYENETNLILHIELTIKGISKIIETNLKIKKLSTGIVQILGNLEFSRNDFNIGTGKWSNTTFLKDKIIINSNIFLIKE